MSQQKSLMDSLTRCSSTNLVRLALLHLLLQLAGLVHGAIEFHGQVVPSHHYIKGEQNAPIGWIVEVECKKGCLKHDKQPLVFPGEVRTADSRFVVDLTNVLDSKRRKGVELLVTVKSMRELGGQLRVSRRN
jgi:hypothetical protein